MRNIETFKKIYKYDIDSPKKIIQKVLNKRNKINLFIFGEETR